MRTKTGVLRLLLACLFVLAQQAALVHAAWHAARGPAAPYALDRTGKSGPQGERGQGRLCVFDVALGQVLGSACGAQAVSWQIEQVPWHHVAAPLFHRAAESVPFLSRGPPFLS